AGGDRVAAVQPLGQQGLVRRQRRVGGHHVTAQGEAAQVDDQRVARLPAVRDRHAEAAAALHRAVEQARRGRRRGGQGGGEQAGGQQGQRACPSHAAVPRALRSSLGRIS